MKLGKPIAFYPQLARAIGGIKEAIFYQQIYFWSDKGSRSDGFIYKSKEDITTETTLTRREQDRVRKILVKSGWLEVQKIKANGAPTLHYKPLKDLNVSILPLAPNVLIHKYEKDGSPICSTENTTENTLHSADVSAQGVSDAITGPVPPTPPAVPAKQKKPKKATVPKELMNYICEAFKIALGAEKSVWGDKEWGRVLPYAKELGAYCLLNNLTKEDAAMCIQQVSESLKAAGLSWSPEAVCNWKVDWHMQTMNGGKYKGFGKAQ